MGESFCDVSTDGLRKDLIDMSRTRRKSPSAHVHTLQMRVASGHVIRTVKRCCPVGRIMMSTVSLVRLGGADGHFPKQNAY